MPAGLGFLNQEESFRTILTFTTQISLLIKSWLLIWVRKKKFKNFAYDET